MKENEIKKIISKYTKKKMYLSVLLVISAFFLSISIILRWFYNAKMLIWLGVISYLCMVIILIIACRFNLNQVIININTIDDFKEVLKYLSEIPDDIGEQEYCDSLHIIINSLKKHVYYGEKKEDKLLESHLRYLQIVVFNYEESIQLFSSQLLDNKFLKKISKIMLFQIEKEVFEPDKLNNIVKNEKVIQKYKSISWKLFISICNIFLIIIVIIKSFITCNIDWYNNISETYLGRLFYNTSTDIMAAILAVVALKSN